MTQTQNARFEFSYPYYPQCNGMVNYKFMTIFPPVRPYFVRFCLSDVDNGWDWIRKLQQVQDSRFCMYISTQRVLISATSLTKLKEKFKLFLFNFWLGWKSWLCVSCEFMVCFFLIWWIDCYRMSMEKLCMWKM